MNDGRIELAVFTKAVGLQPQSLRQRLGQVKRRLASLWFGLPVYGGPKAVARSLTEGLKACSVNFIFDPSQLPEGKPLVGVLSDLRALREAILWREQGKITRLIAGPNLVILPSDAKELIASPWVDLYLVNSQWTYDAYLADCPELKDRLRIWPAGVNPEAWKAPEGRRGLKKIALLYQKSLEGHQNASQKLVDESIVLLRKAGFEAIHLKYGRYQPAQFREALWDSELALFFSPIESQGIALAEAWAADVPTLVWENNIFHYAGRTLRSSSAPYLSKQTGKFFRDVDELQIHLASWGKIKSGFEPRKWILENLTDELSARKYWELAKGN